MARHRVQWAGGIAAMAVCYVVGIAVVSRKLSGDGATELYLSLPVQMVRGGAQEMGDGASPAEPAGLQSLAVAHPAMFQSLNFDPMATVPLTKRWVTGNCEQLGGKSLVYTDRHVFSCAAHESISAFYFTRCNGDDFRTFTQCARRAPDPSPHSGSLGSLHSHHRGGS